MPNSKTVSISGDEGFVFKVEGDYIINFSESFVQVKLEGGQNTNISDAVFASVNDFDLTNIEHLDLVGINFIQANVGAGFNFAPDVNLNALLDSFLLMQDPQDATTTVINPDAISDLLDRVTVNGSKIDAIKLVWDYLDGAYTQSGYYNAFVNEAFIRLGLEYVEYLDAGGEPLIDAIGKYVADNDADSIPQRSQSLHDNLLGNLAKVSIESRNFSDALEAELLALVPDTYEARGVFSGEESAIGSDDHLSALAFDYDKGWDRPDYIFKSFGAVDARAIDTDGDTLFGDGNTTTGYNIVRHEGAGIELALKVKHRGGADYAVESHDADGTAHYTVLAGLQPGTTNRGEWNFDFAGTVLAAGDDDEFDFRVFVDIDASEEGVNFVEFTPGDNPVHLYSTQNSVNYAFIDSDPLTDGHQAYLGEGVFDIELRAYENGTENLIATNRVVVHVDDPLV
jgi:hypothetical protein